MTTRLRRDFGVHEKTGVLQTFWRMIGTDEIYHIYEPDHILVQGEIEMGKGRKRGVWEFAGIPDKYPAEIYYTCPWCGAIGRTTLMKEMGHDSQSLVCGNMYGAKSIGCSRHLTLSFRKPGKEREGFTINVYF